MPEATVVKPTGFLKGQEIDLLYALHASLYTICAQLDDDSGVTDTNYEALCWTAIINCAIENTKGSEVRNFVEDKGFRTVKPTGINNETRYLIMYNFQNAWETLCEKLDADGGVTDTDYEANCYTAKFLQKIVDPKGVTDLGVATGYLFSPGSYNKKNYMRWLEGAVDALETLGEQLDADGTVNDTDYEANSFTAYVGITFDDGITGEGVAAF